MAPPALTKMKNVGWLILERGVGILIAFFVMTLVARHLGPALFGVYAYVFSLVALLLPLAGFGLETIVMRDIGRAPDQRGDILGSAITLQICASIAAFVCALLFIVFFGGPAGIGLGLMAVGGIQLLLAPTDTFNAYFRASEKLAWVVVPRIAVSLCVAAVAIYLVSQDRGLDAFVTLRAWEQFGFGLAALVAFAIATRILSELRVSKERLIGLAKDGWPLVLSGIAVAIYMRVDQVMLGQLSTETQLGYYGIAVRVAEIALIAPIALRTSLFASIVRAHARGIEPFRHYMQLVYDAMFIGSLGAVLVIACASLLLFVPTFGEAYAPGIGMTLVLLLGVPWIGLATARGAALISMGWLWTSPLTTGIGAIVNIALNFLLIPRFGGLGAAWATVFSYWLVSYGLSLVIPHLRPEGKAMTRSLTVLPTIRRLVQHFRQPQA